MGDVFELVLSALLEAQNLAALIHWGRLFSLRACVNAALWSVLACNVCAVFCISSVDLNGILSAVRHLNWIQASAVPQRQQPCLVKNIVVKFPFPSIYSWCDPPPGGGPSEVRINSVTCRRFFNFGDGKPCL